MKKLILVAFFFSSALRGMDVKLEEQIKKIDKVELHLHLGGSWPFEFLKTIADDKSITQLLMLLDCMDQGMQYEQAFTIFDVISKIVNTDQKVEDGVAALCKQLAYDNVSYVEIRTSVKDLGSGTEGYLQAVLRGIQKGCAQTSLTAKIILSLRRDSSASAVKETIGLINQYRNQGVVGLDISGMSTKGDAASVLLAANIIKENNIPVTLHLGESPQESAAQQLKELITLNPARIGHGVHLSPLALQWILVHKIPIELCLSSAVKVGMIRDCEQHPALHLLADNYPVVICTDDPLIFRKSLSQECAQVAHINKLSIDDMIKLQAQARLYAFA